MSPGRVHDPIVDDVEIVRKALQVGVQRLGPEAEGASDPLVALERARLHPPDLALVGYRCPKVLFVSATPPDEVREKLLPSGLVPAGFVRKPFHLEDLWKTVRDALAN